MKRLAILLVVGVCASVHAAPSTKSSPRKSPPDKFSRSAGEAFKRAVEAEDAGLLEEAARMYSQSLQRFTHANTVFNLASVRERQGSIAEALIDYEAYLTLAPNAPDAAAVRAKVTELEKQPATVRITVREGIDPRETYILVDGVIVKKPGDLVRKKTEKIMFEVKVPRGRHTVDFVTLLGFGHELVDVAPGQVVDQEVFDNSMNGGNVTVSADSRFRIARAYNGFARFIMPPGKQLLDNYDDEHECKPITVDAPANDDVAYIYIKRTQLTGRHSAQSDRCGKHDVVKLLLKF